MFHVITITLPQAGVQRVHDAITAGYLGLFRTYIRIKDRYYFPGCLRQFAYFIALYEQRRQKKFRMVKVSISAIAFGGGPFV